MKETLMDKVIDKLKERREIIKKRLYEEYRHTKPFRTEPVKDEDLLYDYNTKGIQIFKELYETQGEEVAMDYKRQMLTLKAKFGGDNARRIRPIKTIEES